MNMNESIRQVYIIIWIIYGITCLCLEYRVPMKSGSKIALKSATMWNELYRQVRSRKFHGVAFKAHEKY